MKCQILFSRKNKKIVKKCRFMKFLPSMQSVNVFARQSRLACFKVDWCFPGCRMAALGKSRSCSFGKLEMHCSSTNYRSMF